MHAGMQMLERMGKVLETYERMSGPSLITPAVWDVLKNQRSLVTKEYDFLSGK
jgi:hypothetical protein